ncbi:hypothetical protein BLNAU_17890 [Blattamonas nauphoetae]|uniref:Uncharacterized protein n=1 Tax=Blattamonas nauphoetae TaxID=2049346 RepID=A0ABQ9XAE6_9EUKA|nr:hypothetical protein BLNAU_17890 [Blattamonas nauphoetae]
MPPLPKHLTIVISTLNCESRLSADGKDSIKRSDQPFLPFRRHSEALAAFKPSGTCWGGDDSRIHTRSTAPSSPRALRQRQQHTFAVLSQLCVPFWHRRSVECRTCDCGCA